LDWEAAGAIGEIFGALAVLLTLVYLSLQLRQNMRLTKALIRENRTDSSQKIILALADLADIVTGDNSDRAPAENFRLSMVLRAMFRDYEAYSYQRHADLLDETEWQAMRETWRDTLRSKEIRDVWYGVAPQYSKHLHQDLHEILSEEPTLP